MYVDHNPFNTSVRDIEQDSFYKMYATPDKKKRMKIM